MNSTDLEVIYHIATKEDFLHLCDKNSYKPGNFDSDGFIHCTGEPETTLIVLGYYFQQETKEILIIKIAIDKKESKIDCNQTQILLNLPAGTYLIQLYSRDKRKSEKIVVL